MSRFSILTPVYRPPEKALQAMLASVARQSLGDWEHCLVDDHSGDPAIRELLDAAAAGDPRVQVRYRDRQGGIVATTNDALAMATGDYVAFLDHDDELSPGALEAMAAAIEQHPGVDYLYSDEDKIDAKGRHFRPFLKPGWSPDRLRSQMYMAHFRVIRRGLVEELGGLRSGFDGSQDWELALRIAERSNRIVHVPEILYHWRTAPGSAAGATEAKPWAHEAALRAVREHIGRSAVAASVERVPDVPGHFWLRPALTSHPPVSIVIASSQPSEAGGASLGCIERLLARSSYDNFELVVAVGAEA